MATTKTWFLNGRNSLQPSDVLARQHKLECNYGCAELGRRRRTCMALEMDVNRHEQGRQVTRFECEGISLGIAFNHVIMDGKSFLYFVRSWSDISTGASNISVHPIHSRSIPMSSEHIPDTTSISSIYQPPSAVYKYSLPYEQYLDLVFTVAPQTKVQQKHFYFSVSTLDKLKQICTESDEKSLKVTSLKAICAYVWKALLKAREANRTSETDFYTIIDMRKRTNPPLEEGYFGNVITVVGAITKTGNLLKDGLSYAVKLLEESVKLATEADVKTVM